MKKPNSLACVFLSLLTLAGTANAQKDNATLATLKISASEASCYMAPVSVMLNPGAKGLKRMPRGALMLKPADSSEILPAQADREGERLKITFILDKLEKGTTRTFQLLEMPGVGGKMDRVEVQQKGADIVVNIGDALFTQYMTQNAPNKPFFYPLLNGQGGHLTRRWPVEPNALPGESTDHPHHRGLWFTHGLVNGSDFWLEGAKAAKTINVGYENLKSGMVYGGFRAKTEWRSIEGKLILTDRRDIVIYPIKDGGRILDFSITLMPAEGAVTLGDTKEGTFALRVPEALTVSPDKTTKIKPEGSIVSAMGDKGAAVWGKPSPWIDYSGPVNGNTWGVAIFDAPTNLRHPQTWHARAYGLFAINPFGLHDFGKGEKGIGNHVIPEKGTLTLRYWVVIHPGDAEIARIAERYAALKAPPTVQVTYPSAVKTATRK